MMHRCFLLTALLTALLSTACLTDDDEKQAEKLYNEAEVFRQTDQYERAIKHLQTIRIEYENTSYASIAEQEISQYESLQQVQLQNINKKIRDRFSSIARSLENYKSRFLAYPLTPADLDKLSTSLAPTWGDVWGRDVYYTPTYSSSSVPAHTPDGYALATFGEDGLPGGQGLNTDHFFKNGKQVVSVTEEE